MQEKGVCEKRLRLWKNGHVVVYILVGRVELLSEMTLRSTISTSRIVEEGSIPRAERLMLRPRGKSRRGFESRRLRSRRGRCNKSGIRAKPGSHEAEQDGRHDRSGDQEPGVNQSFRFLADSQDSMIGLCQDSKFPTTTIESRQWRIRLPDCHKSSILHTVSMLQYHTRSSEVDVD